MVQEHRRCGQDSPIWFIRWNDHEMREKRRRVVPEASRGLTRITGRTIDINRGFGHFHSGLRGGSHRRVSSRRSPILTYRLPAMGVRRDHAPRPQKTGTAATTMCQTAGSPMSCVVHARLPSLRFTLGPPSSRFAPEWLRAGDSRLIIRCGPSFVHVKRPDSAIRGIATSIISPGPEALFPDGRYPASPAVRVSPPPCRSGLALAAGFRLIRGHHQQCVPNHR